MHPELLRLHLYGFERPIQTYGVLIAVGMAVGIAVGVRRGPAYGVPRDDVLHVGLLGVAGGLFGAVALFTLVHFRTFLAHPELWRQPGMVFYGGLLGGAGAAWWYCRKFHVSLAQVADAGAPGLALGHAFGRIGCLMGGCCYGAPVPKQFPLAVYLADDYRHPVQAYEAVGLVLLSLTLMALSRRLRPRVGGLFVVYVVLYALLRLGMESLRGDTMERGALLGLHTSQWIAILVIPAAVLVWPRLRRLPS